MPAEAVSRNLPAKLQDFSRRDMEKLLSSVIQGEKKGDLTEDLKGKRLKAKFIGFTEDGKAKIKIGDTVLIADIKVDEDFIPGEELIFLIKSITPKIELQLIETDVDWAVNYLLKKYLPYIDLENLKVIISHLLKKDFKKLFTEFLRNNTIDEKEFSLFLDFLFSEKGLNSLFFSLKELLVSRNIKKEDYQKLLLSILAFYFLPYAETCFVPLLIKDTDIEIIYEELKERRELTVFFSFDGIMLKVKIVSIGNDVSLEFYSNSEILIENLRKKDGVLKGKLISAGFLPVNITYKVAESIEKNLSEEFTESLRVKIGKKSIDISV